MTSEHILTVREALPCNIGTLSNHKNHQPIKGPQALSCASISDITAFRLPSAEHSWCVLVRISNYVDDLNPVLTVTFFAKEFACREVHESGGDWILYFATNAELERFISALEFLWPYHSEPVSKKIICIRFNLCRLRLQGECFPLSTIPETDPLNKKCMDVYSSLQKHYSSPLMQCF